MKIIEIIQYLQYAQRVCIVRARRKKDQERDGNRPRQRPQNASENNAEKEMKERKESWECPKKNQEIGVLGKYRSLVTSASQGAVTTKN